jgi:hypothetical protein
MKKIVSAFDNSTKGYGTIKMTNSLKQRIEDLANLQEATTKQRRDSLWFGVPIVQLSKKHVYKPDLSFFEDLLEGLQQREQTLRSAVNQTSTARTSMGQKNMMYFQKAWHLRAIATIPSLIDLLDREDESNVT